VAESSRALCIPICERCPRFKIGELEQTNLCSDLIGGTDQRCGEKRKINERHKNWHWCIVLSSNVFVFENPFIATADASTAGADEVNEIAGRQAR
jgi:hypothetical protein